MRPIRRSRSIGIGSWPPIGPSQLLLTGADPELLQPPVNVLQLSLHPAACAADRQLGTMA
jgi:hypothetical protein